MARNLSRLTAAASRIEALRDYRIACQMLDRAPQSLDGLGHKRIDKLTSALLAEAGWTWEQFELRKRLADAEEQLREARENPFSTAKLIAYLESTVAELQAKQEAS